MRPCRLQRWIGALSLRRAHDDVERAAVGELDLLDVAQAVGAVEGVLDRMRDDDLAVGGGGEGVLAAAP